MYSPLYLSVWYNFLMRYSTIFGKTSKSSKEYDSINATLLLKGGFINQLMAGTYSYLPLGLRVLNKIEDIVREEMNKISSEVMMPILVPLANWEQTGRIETNDVLMKATGANEISKRKCTNEYIIGPTHEEVVTPLVQAYNYSYKDLPIGVYQIQTKFRNEARAKSGLMRGREFRMKDLYSFHTNGEDLMEYYEKVKEAYMRVYDRVGLGDFTVIAMASGGNFTKDYSHEFQTICPTGEDTLFRVPSNGLTYNKEVAPSKAPECTETDIEEKEREDVEGVGIIGVEALAKYLNIPVEKTTKTILFEADSGRVIAAAVRGGYDIDEEKLKKVVRADEIKLASSETVKRVTGAEVGYAGILDLPKEVEIIMDESMQGRKNFECGANKTNYHSININFGRDIEKPEKFYDIKVVKEGDLNPDTGEVYEVLTASEVGNIFPLNTKFTDAFGYKYIDENGKPQSVYMGCYGIGTSRVMGVIVERFHDDKGIIWPESIAPFQVHLVGLDLKDEEIKNRVEQIYTKLTEKGVEVLYDDREDTSAGEKFKDADLIGIPHRVVVSKRTGEKLEYKKRSEKDFQMITVEDLMAIL